MRWIFFSLLLVNGLLLIWQVWFVQPQNEEVASQQPQAIGEPAGAEGVSELRLVSELTSPPAQRQVEEPVRQGRRLCAMVGAFSAKADAESFVQKLDALDVGSHIHQLELSAGTKYWVYLPPAPSRRQATERLAELQTRGIDSFVITSGKRNNGISLGVFNDRARAQRHLAQLRSKGLRPMLDGDDRTYQEIWVMLEPDGQEKIASRTWQALLSAENGLEQRQNFCLDVASHENFL